MNDRSSTLIRSLQDPARYAHPVDEIRLIETHSAWVLLTGEFAYKIRKPLDLGFLDFSTLDLRRHFSEEELRLNRRLAPQLYLEVIAITGSPEEPRWNGAGPAIEYAVKMRQFDTSNELDRLAERGGLDSTLLGNLAITIAEFHESTHRADMTSNWGDPDSVWRPAAENFEQLADLTLSRDEERRLIALREWSTQAHRELTPALKRRKQQGHIRECHGDLHLGNIALLDGRPVPFDCLEFNPGLRWIDTICEIAFLVMDLDSRGRSDLGIRFLNDYLHHAGDYAGLACLRFYLVYRAMVRAKVACIRARQSDNREESSVQWESFRNHCALAASYTTEPSPALIITSGLSGCGKTTLTTELLAPCGAIRIRSDVERKRLHGLKPDARSGSPPGGGLYDRASGRKTYDRLASTGSDIIRAGYSAIVDAAFLNRSHRDRFRRLARELDVPFVMLELRAPEEVLRARVRARKEERRDASEAGVEILEGQLRGYEAPGMDEEDGKVVVDASGDFDVEEVVNGIRERARETRNGERAG